MNLDDAALLRGFETFTLPPEAWTHRAHLRVAYGYLKAFGFEEGRRRFSATLPRFNAEVLKTEDALTRGYQETITVAWFRILDSAHRHQEAYPTSDAFLDANPHLLQRTLLRCFYSKERLVTWEAKRAFVEPDLASLPS